MSRNTLTNNSNEASNRTVLLALPIKLQLFLCVSVSLWLIINHGDTEKSGPSKQRFDPGDTGAQEIVDESRHITSERQFRFSQASLLFVSSDSINLLDNHGPSL